MESVAKTCVVMSSDITKGSSSVFLDWLETNTAVPSVQGFVFVRIRMPWVLTQNSKLPLLFVPVCAECFFICVVFFRKKQRREVLIGITNVLQMKVFVLDAKRGR